MPSLAETLWAWRVRFRVDVLSVGAHPLLEEQHASLPHIFVVPDRIANVHVQAGGQSLHLSGGDVFVVAQPSAFPIDVQVVREWAEPDAGAESALWCPAHPGGVLIRLVPHGNVPIQFFSGCPAVVTMPGPVSRVESLSALLTDEVSRLPEICPTAIAHLGNLLLLKALGPLQSSGNGSAAVPAESVPPEVSTSVQLMRDDLARRWTVASLAEEVGMSRSAFASLFSDVVGQTPMSVLLEYRMERAGDLLARSRSSIKQIAAEVGYRSPATFSTVFRKWSGLSPTEFRRSRS
ncbi:HTH-type transcriptional activator Btr [Maioricimonas rarisocia]|uniref:HTH-type transcriptional activator Btr n=1 Tax=Maioricimonas rarisocia TaxID=2528026 RepID=A0A517ZE17_9PLAN|nr:helix-turn-helix transcriptional regulator [Maioricimonas rarisocia]QDU40699.1 HTH-type transcriptional activator Btr [Maioricimonas rarisocia]